MVAILLSLVNRRRVFSLLEIQCF